MQSRRDFLGTTLAGVATMALSAPLLTSTAAHAGSMRSTTQLPRITGPINGGVKGHPFAAYFGDISDRGYVEQEFFIEGLAQRYTPVGQLGVDGLWTVEPSSRGHYKTRILVRRPRNPLRFNGTVVVEWTNVSAGFEVNFGDTPMAYDGRAYVTVSAQRHGVYGYEATKLGLVHWDPERYGSLDIPDDALSYDIFSQVGNLLKSRVGSDHLLQGLRVQRLIAVGASQSGTRVLAYANGIQPRDCVYDAIMPLICAGSAGDFSPEPAHPEPGSGGHSRNVPTRVRADLSIPVMPMNTETEALFYVSRRQPNTSKFHYWEVAGASHAPTPLMARIARVVRRDGLPVPGWGSATSSSVDWQPTLDAALVHVERWIKTGTPPPAQQPMVITGSPAAYARDEYGNAVGGVRLPEVEVPIAVYRGFGPNGSIGGQTIPFSEDQLRSLYPSHAEYVARVRAAARSAEVAGVILPYRTREYIAGANSAPIPPA